MKDYLLVPDLAATTKIDPERSRIEMFCSAEELAEYDANVGEKPSIEIGYIPASKLTEISAMEIPEDKSKQILAMAEQQRELVRYGVRSWNLRGEFAIENGRCADSVIDVIERRHWLVPLAVEVSRYNSLSEEKKSQ